MKEFMNSLVALLVAGFILLALGFSGCATAPTKTTLQQSGPVIQEEMDKFLGKWQGTWYGDVRAYKDIHSGIIDSRMDIIKDKHGKILVTYSWGNAFHTSKGSYSPEVNFVRRTGKVILFLKKKLGQFEFYCENGNLIGWDTQWYYKIKMHPVKD